jgi:L-serine dehydratase
MRFKDIFAIIGPSMIGPSSSHTAGAVRLGLVGRKLLGGQPERAKITLFGSFAETYQGHGTDLALMAGLLGFGTDDDRIPQALVLAEQCGMQVTFGKGSGRIAHPNTAEMELTRGERTISLRGASIGGGSIEIHRVDDFDVTFTGMYPTVLIYHDDALGVIAGLTQVLKETGMNISYMDVDRTARNGAALTVIEVDQIIDEQVVSRMGLLPYVRRVAIVDLMGKEEEGI